MKHLAGYKVLDKAKFSLASIFFPGASTIFHASATNALWTYNESFLAMI